MMPNMVINIVPKPRVYGATNNGPGASKLPTVPRRSIMLSHKTNAIKESEKDKRPKPDGKNFRYYSLAGRPMKYTSS